MGLGVVRLRIFRIFQGNLVLRGFYVPRGSESRVEGLGGLGGNHRDSGLRVWGPMYPQ